MKPKVKTPTIAHSSGSSTLLFNRFRKEKTPTT